MSEATVAATVGGVYYEAVLILERDGDTFKIGGREKRTVKVGRVFRVEIDGIAVGYVKYVMITRERRGRGQRYVTARWQSPGWKYCQSGDSAGYYFECVSRRDGAERVIHAYARNMIGA